MRTLHFGLRVTDLERSLAFYEAVGYEVVGSVPETEIGHLTMLKLPGDDFVTVELVHDPTAAVERVTGLSHFVVKVESMVATLDGLAAKRIGPVASGQEGEDGFRTAFVVDPDGATGSSWSSGRPVTPRASPRLTGRRRLPRKEIRVGKTIMGVAAICPDGLIADDKDEVGPLFDWYANGVVWTLPGTDNEVRSTRASADLMRSHYRDAAVVVGRRLFDFVKGWNDARARFGKGVI